MGGWGPQCGGDSMPEPASRGKWGGRCFCVEQHRRARANIGSVVCDASNSEGVATAAVNIAEGELGTWTVGGQTLRPDGLSLAFHSRSICAAADPSLLLQDFETLDHDHDGFITPEVRATTGPLPLFT